MTTAQRLTRSALAAGLTPCEWDRPDTCQKCHEYGPCHAWWEYEGGRGYERRVVECHNDDQCRERRTRR